MSDYTRISVGEWLGSMHKNEEAEAICDALTDTIYSDHDCDLIATIRAGLAEESPEYELIGYTLIKAITDYHQDEVPDDDEPEENDAQCASDIIDAQEISAIKRGDY